MKSKVQATREKASDKKTKVQLRTLKAELAELQDDESEIEEIDAPSKDEKQELKAIKRRINTVMKKIQDIEGDVVEHTPSNDSVDVVGQVKLKKKSVDVPIHGGTYGLSVMAPRISGMGKMSQYGGII
jgi:chromosome segregation ATPase